MSPHSRRTGVDFAAMDRASQRAGGEGVGGGRLCVLEEEEEFRLRLGN